MLTRSSLLLVFAQMAYFKARVVDFLGGGAVLDMLHPPPPFGTAVASGRCLVPRSDRCLGPLWATATCHHLRRRATAASDYSRLGPQPSRTSPQTHASGRLHLGRGSDRFRPHDGPQPPCVTVSDRIMQQPVGLLWDYCATWDRDTRRAASECHFRSPLLRTLRRTVTAPQASRGGGAI